MDPFTTEFGEQYFRPGVCPLCYLRDGRVVEVGTGRRDDSPKSIETVNQHMAEVHNSSWRYLGHQGRASLLLADVSQLAEHPETVEEMYEALMDSFKQGERGLASRQFESGKLTHDVQAVLVNESGGSDSGSLTFGRVGNERPYRFVEVKVIWDDSAIRSEDRDFAEFLVASSTMLNMFGFTLDEIKGYLKIDEK